MAGQEVLKQSQSLVDLVIENTRNKDTLTTLLAGYENCRAENQNLKDMVENQMKLVYEYKKENEEFKGTFTKGMDHAPECQRTRN